MQDADTKVPILICGSWSMEHPVFLWLEYFGWFERLAPLWGRNWGLVLSERVGVSDGVDLGGRDAPCTAAVLGG